MLHSRLKFEKKPVQLREVIQLAPKAKIKVFSKFSSNGVSPKVARMCVNCAATHTHIIYCTIFPFFLHCECFEYNIHEDAARKVGE